MWNPQITGILGCYCWAGYEVPFVVLPDCCVVDCYVDRCCEVTVVDEAGYYEVEETPVWLGEAEAAAWAAAAPPVADMADETAACVV